MLDLFLLYWFYKNS